MKKEFTKQIITLNITEDSAQRLNHMVGEANFSVAELLENFIADLTGGLENNGSNECDAAQHWFELVTYWPDHSFLSYLCSNYSDGVQDVIDLQDDIECLETQLADARNDKMTLKQILSGFEDCEEVRSVNGNYEKAKALYIESMLEEIKCYQKELDIYWNGYQKESGSDETLEDAVAKLRKWQTKSFEV